MHNRWLVAALIAVTGCAGIPQIDFVSEYEELYCDGYVICATDEMLRTVGERECHEFMRSTPYPDTPECKFDRVAAEACIENLGRAGCVGNDPELPQVCADVFSRCQYNILPREDGSTVIE